MAGVSKRPVMKQIRKSSSEAAVKRLSRPLEAGTGRAAQKAGATILAAYGKQGVGGKLGTDNDRANIRKRANQSRVAQGKKPLPMYKGKNNAN